MRCLHQGLSGTAEQGKHTKKAEVTEDFWGLASHKLVTPVSMIEDMPLSQGVLVSLRINTDRWSSTVVCL